MKLKPPQPTQGYFFFLAGGQMDFQTPFRGNFPATPFIRTNVFLVARMSFHVSFKGFSGPKLPET